MMKNREFTNEHFLYLLALALALALRLTGLGQPGLSEFEAGWAMQAYGVSEGGAAAISGQPAYVIPTGFLFWLLGSGEALARFLPALVGSALVLLPFALRDKIGKEGALLAAFGLALDPGLMSAARVAGGPMMALSFVTLTLTALWRGKPSLAGVLGALALMSGPETLTGLAGLSVAVLLWSLWGKEESLTLPVDTLKQAGLAAGVTVLAAGTLFLRYPQGISAMFAAIPDFFTDWLGGEGVPLVQALAALPVYQPAALVFGLLAAANKETRQDPFGRFLVVWFVSAAAFVLLSPSRQAVDLIWALLPLWGLAGMQLSRYFRSSDGNRMAVWGQAGLMVLFLVYFWMNQGRLAMMNFDGLSAEFNLFRLNEFGPVTQKYVMLSITNVLVPVFAAAAVVLIGLGWGFEEAERGTVLGALAALGLYVFSVGWRSAHVPEAVVNELWYPNPGPSQSELLRDTVEELSEWSTGHKQTIELVYLDDSASLAWTLRDFPRAQFANQLPVGELPPVVIFRLGAVDDTRLSPSYRGQSFNWDTEKAWESALPGEFSKWWVYREAPIVSQTMVLWARADLFPVEMETGAGEGALVEPGSGFDGP